MAPHDRPVIGFLTDFGLDGAAAICKGVMLSIAPDAQIVDISHSVGKYAIRDGAYLLWTALPWLPVGVHVAVVDPGVGTARRPIAVRTGRGDALVGPDNGLLMPAASRLGGIVEARLIENSAWTLRRSSATFHGRDIFAPVAGHLAAGGAFDDVGPAIDPTELVGLELPPAKVVNDQLGSEVVYVDSFGNLRLAGGAADLRAALVALEHADELLLELGRGGEARRATARWARTFGDVRQGELLLYEDSSGNLALAESGGNAAVRLGATTGTWVGIRRA
jgi:S-adenosyl-L-methionine hydrolase (adenosine-forming)